MQTDITNKHGKFRKETLSHFRQIFSRSFSRRTFLLTRPAFLNCLPPFAFTLL